MGYVKTAVLMAAMTALFMGVGYLIGGYGGAVIALGVAAVMNALPGGTRTEWSCGCTTPNR